MKLLSSLNELSPAYIIGDLEVIFVWILKMYLRKEFDWSLYLHQCVFLKFQVQV
jgi:hypothetical protein